MTKSLTFNYTANHDVTYGQSIDNLSNSIKKNASDVTEQQLVFNNVLHQTRKNIDDLTTAKQSYKRTKRISFLVGAVSIVLALTVPLLSIHLWYITVIMLSVAVASIVTIDMKDRAVKAIEHRQVCANTNPSNLQFKK